MQYVSPATRGSTAFVLMVGLRGSPLLSTRLTPVSISRSAVIVMPV
jgi:hypothetical protein